MKIKSLDIVCKGYLTYYGCDGHEFDCGYENSCEFGCEDCVCNFGNMNPINGKRINFILRFIQNKRAIKYYKIKEKENTNTRGLRSKIKGIM